MRKTSLYGEQREAAIVLLAAKSLFRGREQDLAIASDGGSRIVGSVVDSKREHSLYPPLLSAAFSAVATAADQKSRRPLLALEPPEDMRLTALIYRPKIGLDRNSAIFCRSKASSHSRCRLRSLHGWA